MSPADFNLRHLRAVAAAVRLGSLSAAAKAVGISQPAVTQALGKVETLTGVRLVERAPGGVTPTDAGILLAARAEAAGAALAAAFGSQRKGGIGASGATGEGVTMAQLTALVALADAGSYSGGAAARGVAQPSLHRAVAELERVSGVPLVERRGRGTALTAAGERLVQAGRLVLAELQAALDELAVLGGRDQGTIRIGADAAAMAHLVPRAVSRFTAEHPPVVIDVMAAEGAAGAEQLRSGRLDALVALDDPSFGGGALTSEPLAEQQLAIAARAGHPVAAGSAPGLVRLAGFGWALPPRGSDARTAWEKLFLDGGLYPPAPRVTLPSLPGLAELAAKGDLLTILPQDLIADAGGRLVPVGTALRGPSLMLVTRAGWAPTPAQATFLAEIRAAAGPHLAF